MTHYLYDKDTKMECFSFMRLIVPVLLVHVFFDVAKMHLLFLVGKESRFVVHGVDRFPVPHEIQSCQQSLSLWTF